MNSSDHGENSDGEKLEREREPIQGIKLETDDCAISETTEGPRKWSLGTSEATSKRTAMDMGCDAHNSELDQSTSSKRVRVSSEAGRRLLRRLSEESTRPQPLCLTSADQEKTIASYRKPLYSISHRITEKKLTSSLDQHAQHEGGVRLSYSSLLSPQLVNTGEHSRSEPLSALGAAGSMSSTDSNLYSLIEKMFFILNTLNSSMTQLHSKVDLLSLEVTRIKKQIKPSEMATEFQPPPEYLLTNEELSQLMEQTSNAGELGCRLLVHLFPELLKANECTRGCIINKRTLDSLHLQLIRNYVEVCFPLVKNNNIWQDECLLQINDFFNRFWAQKDMESGQQSCGKQTITSFGFKAEQNQPCHFINEEGQEVHLDLDSNGDHTNNNKVVPDLVFDTQEVGEDLDELSSPEDFVMFLVNRLFPEVFEEGKFPEGSVGKMILDSDRIEIIRKYMEANFPDVSEDSWLQVCVQRIEDAIEGSHSNGNGSDPENMNDESYDSTSLPDDVSIIKISDLCDYERPGRRSKKSLLVPVDFEQLEMPLPEFSVPQEYLLSREQLRNNYDCSLSIGNFASRLLVLMFPELFTYDNARKHYNCSGSLGKKQLDPVRVDLIRHYVQLLYPRAKNDRVWTLEFVGKLDERCRRRDTEQRRSYQQQRKVYAPELEQEPVDFVAACQVNQLNTERLKDFEIPPLPPEKSSKDFCKIPLEKLTVSIPDFPVPSVYWLSDTEVREIVQQSLSVGNFAARLLVRLFPELFTQENLRLQYNHSGACNKKQLDPVRLRLIRHYVEAVYPVEKMEEVWHYECVPSIDERCRRPNRKKCDILKKAKRSNTVS
ncbi:BEN domain-containing protein 3 [Coregonus clupeaformis]|uniref:BEN domain-containing protein 3 n=1 Tax=Coregonus clupeaformis TaxID=59861 RepID=UPI001E1C7917|nr:BEN domain-containing protein 3 [Coregonus clupeaformis]